MLPNSVSPAKQTYRTHLGLRSFGPANSAPFSPPNNPTEFDSSSSRDDDLAQIGESIRSNIKMFRNPPIIRKRIKLLVLPVL
jgi:hypothetical protein